MSPLRTDQELRSILLRPSGPDVPVMLPDIPDRRLVPMGWMILAGLYGYGVWWIFGISNFIWVILAVPMVLSLLVQRQVRVPDYFLPWLLFLVLAFLSIVRIDSGTRLLLWGYRWSVYLSAGICFLYVYNLPRRRFGQQVLLNALVAYWGWMILGGLVGILVPTVRVESLLEIAAPGLVALDPFLKSLISPSLAQVHDFLGFPVARPTAPFPYTNTWGSNVALLTPFVVVWGRSGGRRRRLIAIGMGLIAVVPVVLSLNRGLWLTLGIGLLYAMVRQALHGQWRPLAGFMTLIVLVGALVVFSPLGELVALRAETGHSDTRRSALYVASIELANEQPITGYGSPVYDETISSDSTPLGTHGQFWTVLVSYGYPATIMFVAVLVLFFLRTRRFRSDGFEDWVGVMLVIAMAQLFIYSLVPAQLPVIFLVAGAALRPIGADEATIENDRDPAQAPA